MKDKGLTMWKKVLKHYGISLKKAKKGVYIPEMGEYMQLYFDSKQDKWLMRPINPKMN